MVLEEPKINHLQCHRSHIIQEAYIVTTENKNKPANKQLMQTSPKKDAARKYRINTSEQRTKENIRLGDKR